MSNGLLLLGCGYTLSRLVERGRVRGPLFATTRQPERRAWLEAHGVTVSDDVLALVRAHPGARIVNSVPPEAGLDAALAECLRSQQPPPERFVYLSSTGVYGRASGDVTETTEVDRESAGASRIEAEERFRPLGASALRIAGIYGPGRGLHERLRKGDFKLPGNGENVISRIHVDDLCGAIETVLEKGEPGALYNVADDAPVPFRDVVAWLSEKLGVPMPPSIPLESVPSVLRGNRSVRNHALHALGWRPEFPSYREGFTAAMASAAPTR